MPLLTVVIPTYNEEKYIDLLLNDLNNQTVLPEKIIVADCFSEDQTLMVVKAFKSSVPVQVVQPLIRSPGSARNAGAKVAKTDYLLFIDADMRVPANFIKELTKTLNELNSDFLTPKYVPDKEATFMDRFMINGINWKIARDIQKHGNAFGIGGVMCVRRSLHQLIGGFVESMQTSEDIEYVTMLSAKGASAVYRPDLEVTVSSRRTLKDGKTVVLLRFIPEKLAISKKVIQPLLKKMGREKKYGHYHK